VKTVRTTAELRAELRKLRSGGAGRIGLVPTMGALHDGHASLIRASTLRCSSTVVSLFVNPRQFGDAADLDGYPRTEAEDAARAAAAGATILFAPDVDEVYPDGFSAEVRVSGPLTERLEGAHRGPEHFHGVATVVTKLLNMVGPDIAFFGAKDAQQVLVIRRLVRDLNLPVDVVTVPTVREPDGLALSSRNVRLSPEDRVRARAIPRAIQTLISAVADGARDTAALVDTARAVLAEDGLEAEYVAIVDPATLEPRAVLGEPSLLALAVPVGPVRLIDNTLLSAVPSDSPVPSLSGAGRTGGFVVPPTPQKG
jgi:pantoate--beta-alanine ligase